MSKPVGFFLVAVWLLGSALVASETTPVTVSPQAKSPPSPERHLLRYKFHAGEKIRWRVAHRSAVRATVQGETQATETVSKSIKVWRVTEVTPQGEATFEHLVEDVEMWQKATGQPEASYKSADDKQPPPGYQRVAESVGKVLSVIALDARGQVREREQRSTSSMPGGGEVTLPLPEEPIAVGESWSLPQTIDVPTQGGLVRKIRLLQQFTLEEVNDGVATIRLANLILTPIHDPAIEAKLIQRQSRGTVRFDIVAGRMLSQQVDLDRRVVNFQGESSSLSYATRLTEELLPAEESVAARTQ